MIWLHSDLSRPVAAPIQSDASHRSAALLALVVGQFCPELAARYQRRDLNGDGQDETFCNFFTADVSTAMGAPVPQLKANEQVAWLTGEEGKRRGWASISEHAAIGCVGEGMLCVVGWADPAGGHGHIAVGVPSLDGEHLYIAQAGASNFLCRRVTAGFGALPVQFFVHP